MSPWSKSVVAWSVSVFAAGMSVGCEHPGPMTGGGPESPPSAQAATGMKAPTDPVATDTTSAAIRGAPVAVASGMAGTKRYVRPSKEQLQKQLTPEQFSVTQEEGTERPFHNEYWNNHEPGIYVDITTGEPLFSSADKFESGTGWPSFTRPIDKTHVVSHTDSTLGMERTEVRSSAGDAHLGHVFDDGPAPTGQRYCINSASLRFIPLSKLQAEGYGEYAALFSAPR